MRIRLIINFFNMTSIKFKIITIVILLLDIYIVKAQWGYSAPNIYPNNATDKVVLGGLLVAQSQLHQDIAGNTNLYHQFTNGNTGNSNATSGFQVGIRYDNV